MARLRELIVWEPIEDRDGAWGGATDRLPVPGGWIYRVREWGGVEEAFSVALVFVPGRREE